MVAMLTGCTINLYVHDYREKIEAEPPTAQPLPPTDKPSPPTLSSRYAEIYFDTTPSKLANIRLISDGTNNNLNKVLGKTPITVRLFPGVKEPFDTSICNRTIIVLYELKGFSAEKVAQKISCFSSTEKAEKSPNEIVGILKALR